MFFDYGFRFNDCRGTQKLIRMSGNKNVVHENMSIDTKSNYARTMLVYDYRHTCIFPRTLHVQAQPLVFVLIYGMF